MAYIGSIIASSNALTASGITFAQLQASGVSGHLEKLIAAQVATVAPTAAPTATATGGGSTGGLLAAGTYYFVQTETNGVGETTISPEGSQLTVSAGNKPRFTWPSLKTGNNARNLYLGALNGSSGGPYYLYASGQTASTYDAITAVPANSYAFQPPTVNTTALSRKKIELLRSFKDGNAEDFYRYFRTLIATFSSGEPIAFADVITKFRDADVVISMLKTLVSEAGTLLDANAGTLGPAATGIGQYTQRRTWP